MTFQDLPSGDAAKNGTLHMQATTAGSGVGHGSSAAGPEGGKGGGAGRRGSGGVGGWEAVECEQMLDTYCVVFQGLVDHLLEQVLSPPPLPTPVSSALSHPARTPREFSSVLCLHGVTSLSR